MMRLLHPFMPFITEEIWQTIPHQGDSIVIQSYPVTNPAWQAPEAEEDFNLLEHTVSLVRTGRALLNYPPGQPLQLSVLHEDRRHQARLTDLRSHVMHLARGTWDPNGLPVNIRSLSLVKEGLSVRMVVGDDVDLKKALDRLVKQIAEADKESQRLDGKLGSDAFVSNAPPEVIADHKNRLRALARDRAMLASSEQQLRVMLGV
jgi:valyl-tRNA synthetase